MIKAIKSVLDKASLTLELVSKQGLYAQMVRDHITGPAKKEVENDIASLTLQLYGHGTQQQRG